MSYTPAGDAQYWMSPRPSPCSLHWSFTSNLNPRNERSEGKSSRLVVSSQLKWKLTSRQAYSGGFPGNETPWDHEKLPFSTLLKKSLGSLQRRITSALMKETWKFKNWLRWRDPFIRPTWHMLRVLWRTLPSVLYEATSMSSFVRSRTSGGLRFVQKLEISERCLRSL